MSHKQRFVSPWLAVALVTLLALALRLAWLGSKPLWIDEADSFYFASQPVSEIFFRLCDPHPPGYYILLKAFLPFGQSEFWVRLPSAIAGALAIPLLYALGQQLGATLDVMWLDRRTSFLASLLLAVAPLHVWYSQEARMYTLVTLWGLCAVYLAARFATGRRVVDALGYLFSAIAAVYVDQSSVLPLLLANLVWGGLWLRRRRASGERNYRALAMWVGLQAVVGISFWLWQSRALFPTHFGNTKLYQLAMVMLTLQKLGVSVTLAGVRQALGVVVTVLVAMGVLIGVLFVRSHRLRRWLIHLPLLVVPLFVLITFASAVPRFFTVKRLLVSLLPYGLLVSAWAMRELWLRAWVLTVLVAFSLVLCGVNVLLIPKGPWRELVAVVQAEVGSDDELWVDELAVPVFNYYYDGPHQVHVLRTSRLYELGDAWDMSARDSTGGGRIWVIALTDRYRNLLDYLELPDPDGLVWSRDWPGVSGRAYTLAHSGLSIIDPPAWLSAWPSPVDEACQTDK